MDTPVDRCRQAVDPGRERICVQVHGPDAVHRQVVADPEELGGRTAANMYVVPKQAVE